MEDAPYSLRNRRFTTLPNLLSLTRIFLLPLSLWTLERQASHGTLPVLITIACALGTDAFDGLLARRRGWASDLGRVLDPLADKIYLGGLVLYLTLKRGFPLWLVGLVLARDLLLVAGGALLARRYGIVFAANVWGKLSTVVLSVLIFAYVLAVEAVLPWLVGAVVFALVVSLVSYLRQGARFVREREEPAQAV